MRYPNKQPIVRRVRVTSPAAAANWSFRAEQGNLVLVKGFVFTLATDANPANRGILVRASEDGVVWFHTTAQFVQAASTTIRYGAHPGSNGSAGNGSAVLFEWPSDGLVLPVGHTLDVTTSAVQPGDQYSAIVLDVVEFPATYPEWLMPLSGTHGFTYNDNDDMPGGH